MVSAAVQNAAIPLRRSDYDKRIQENILSLLLRRIKENTNSSSLIVKYQRFRELLAENKTSEISQFIDKFQKELIGLNDDRQKNAQAKQQVVSNRKNNYVNSIHFKRLFPQANVLFELSEYGIAAREVLRETIEGVKKGDIEYLSNSGMFKKQSCFNGMLLESYSNESFDGFKGFQLDFYF